MALATEAVVQLIAVRVAPNDLYFDIVSVNATEKVQEIRVRSVKAGSLAEKSGIREGDHLTAVDGSPVVGKTLTELLQDGKILVRDEMTFEGHRGWFRKHWSLTVETETFKERKASNPSPGPAVSKVMAHLER